MKKYLLFTLFFTGITALQSMAQQTSEGYIAFAQAIKKYAPDIVPKVWKCTEKLRWDYYWEMADGTIAINKGVRCYRGDNYVFSSIFDQTGGDCDTEVWQNGRRYQNLCVGNAGGNGTAFVDSHGGVTKFYRK